MLVTLHTTHFHSALYRFSSRFNAVAPCQSNKLQRALIKLLSPSLGPLLAETKTTTRVCQKLSSSWAPCARGTGGSLLDLQSHLKNIALAALAEHPVTRLASLTNYEYWQRNDFARFAIRGYTGPIFAPFSAITSGVRTGRAGAAGNAQPPLMEWWLILTLSLVPFLSFKTASVF
jgi:hypothetical protein